MKKQITARVRPDVYNKMKAEREARFWSWGRMIEEACELLFKKLEKKQ